MTYEVIAEIIPNKPYRLIYLNNQAKPLIKEYPHRFMGDKVFCGFYGFIKAFGTPLEVHLDAIVLTNSKVSLGDSVLCKVIGAFKRSDNDHKILLVENNSKIDDILQLPNTEINALLNLYDNKNSITDDDKVVEGWITSHTAKELIKEIKKSRKI